MLYHYLLTSLPELSQEIILDNKLDYTVDSVLAIIKENITNEADLLLYYISFYEDLKNIIAKLQGLSFIFTPFTRLKESLLKKEISEILDDDEFIYFKFFKDIDLSQNLFDLEWEIYNKFINEIKSPLVKEYYSFDFAIKYLFETKDLDKKEYFIDKFNERFNKTYFLAKELEEELRTKSPLNRELFIAKLKLNYLQILEQNTYFTKVNVEVYLLKLLIHSRFMNLDKDLSAKNINNFLNYKLEF